MVSNILYFQDIQSKVFHIQDKAPLILFIPGHNCRRLWTVFSLRHYLGHILFHPVQKLASRKDMNVLRICPCFANMPRTVPRGRVTPDDFSWLRGICDNWDFWVVYTITVFFIKHVSCQDSAQKAAFYIDLCSNHWCPTVHANLVFHLLPPSKYFIRQQQVGEW